jgi:Xaa-Pro aminopeptidase
MHKAHLMDGIALTKLIYDLKVTYADSLDSLTELDISRLLEEKKTVFSSYIEPSFETISAYAQNAAIVHYAPRRDSSKRLAKEGFLLLDSGGQYFEGTTDVTRTIALGPLTHDEKLYYTAVLKGHLQLMKSLIDPQTPTRMLDEKARRPLWDLGVDYLHGTGHGVGFVLSVHEGPVRIINANNHHLEDKPLLRGNIVSDEPGYYREGAFGVRIENLLVVERTAGRRLYFDPLTVVPYEPDAILADEMTEQEITWLNRYHEHVYEKLAPHLSSREREWLQLQTAPVKPRSTEES